MPDNGGTFGGSGRSFDSGGGTFGGSGRSFGPIANDSLNFRKFYDPYRLGTFQQDIAVKGIPILFITTPLLNFSKENINYDDFFKFVNDTDPELLSLLSYGGQIPGGSTTNTSPFIKLLSNKFTEFSPKSTVSQPKEIGETFYGYKQYLAGPYINSVTGDTTSISYTDNSNLDVLKIHKIWADYIEHVNRGEMRPSAIARKNRFIDYTSSIYMFVLDKDAETIQFYQKLTGCTPINIPYDAFSSKISNNMEVITYNIEYAYSFKEDMNPRSLMAFNAISATTDPTNIVLIDDLPRKLLGSEDAKTTYDNTADILDDDTISKAKIPVVVVEKDTDGVSRYKLKFLAENTK